MDKHFDDVWEWTHLYEWEVDMCIICRDATVWTEYSISVWGITLEELPVQSVQVITLP